MTTRTTHQHAVDTTTDPRVFNGAVYREPYTQENPAAHGGVTYHEVCTCGFVRAVNSNSGHREVSPWGPSTAQLNARDRERADREAWQKRVERARKLATPDPDDVIRVDGCQRDVKVANGVLLHIPTGTTADDLLGDDTPVQVTVGGRRRASTTGELRRAARTAGDDGAGETYAAIGSALP